MFQDSNLSIDAVVRNEPDFRFCGMESLRGWKKGIGTNFPFPNFPPPDPPSVGA